MNVRAFSTGARALTLGVILALALGACAKKGIDAPSRKPVDLIALESGSARFLPVFEGSVGAKSRFEGSSKDAIDLRPALAGDTLVVASRSGAVEAFASGRLAWRAQLEEAITSGVAFDASSQSVIVATRSGKVYALDGQSGAARWQSDLGASVLAPPLIAANRVLLSANNGVFYGLNLQNGAVVWQFGSQKPNVSVRGGAKPLRLDANTALFGAADGRIYALDSDSGRLLWTRRVGVAIGGSDVGRMSDVDGTPLVVGDRLYVTSYSGNFMGFDMATGRALFAHRDFPSLRSVVALGGQLVGADTDGVIYGFDAQTGERLWRNNALKFRKPSNPVSLGDYVVFGDFEGYIHVLNQDGDLVARTRLNKKAAVVSVQADGDRVYAQSADGYAQMWRFAR